MELSGGGRVEGARRVASSINQVGWRLGCAVEAGGEGRDGQAVRGWKASRVESVAGVEGIECAEC